MFAPAAATATETVPWLDQLNPEQRAAATHPGGPLLILAGAGTGKTTTLCSRVAWLVNEGVAPERILLLTFTRRAAREMLQRARALAPIPSGSRGVLGGTFHSVAHRFVRMHAASLGLAPGFAVLDAGDAADLLDLIREEHGHAQRQRRFPKKSTLLDIYSRTVNAQRTLSEVVAENFPWCEDHVEDIAALLKAYTARKRALGRDRPRRPAAVLARAGRRRGARARAWRMASITCSSTSTRTSTGCRSRSCSACAAAAARSPPSATTCRRSTGGARRRRSTSSNSPTTFPRQPLVTLERNYRSTPADPRHRQRARGAGVSLVSQAVAHRARARAPARSSSSAATSPRRPSRCASGFCRLASREWSCARRRC